MRKTNPLKNWRTVSQFAKQCNVTPQAIRDAIKVGKIEAWPVGESTLIHKSQIPLFEKTRKVKWEQVDEGRFKRELVPALGRKANGQND